MIERSALPESDHDLLIELRVIQGQQDKRLSRIESALIFVVSLIVVAFFAGLVALMRGWG